MSSETIRNRFSESKRAFTEEELNYLTVLDGINHYAIGVEEARHATRGVGLIRMVRSSTLETEAEIAITLIDEYQGMGLGTLLLNLMILACHERGIETLSFTFLPSNEGILKLIQRAGKVFHLPSNHDSTHVCLKMSTLNLVPLKNEAQRIIAVLSDYPYAL